MTQSIRISSIELLVTCPHCGDPVPVNSLETQVACDNCQNEFAVTPKTWARIVNGLDEDWVELSQAPEGKNKRNWSLGFGSGPRVVYGPDNPSCVKCQTLLPIHEYPFGSQGEIPCPSCGNSHVTYPAPAWLKQHAPTVEQFYCGDPPQGDATGAALHVEQSSAQPVVMQIGRASCRERVCHRV